MTNISPPANALCAAGDVMADYGDMKWITWGANYRNLLTNVSLTCLSDDLQKLPLNRTNRNGVSPFCPLFEDVYNCIIGKVTNYDQAQFSSASVILGIGPALLSLIAPSVGELCMLSSNRPLLSLLISVGAPSAFCFRALAYDDPLENLKTSGSLFARRPLRGKSRAATAAAISAVQYVLAFASAFNVVHAAVELGRETLLSWRPYSSFFPFLWMALASTVQFISTVAWLFSDTMRGVHARERERTGGTVGSAVRGWIVGELTPNVARRRRGFAEYEGRPESRLIIFANIFAQLASLFIVLFGTFVFSSLTLIGVRDAFYYTLRFFFSAFACRAIVMFEMSGMVAVEKEDVTVVEVTGGKEEGRRKQIERSESDLRGW